MIKHDLVLSQFQSSFAEATEGHSTSRDATPKAYKRIPELILELKQGLNKIAEEAPAYRKVGFFDIV